MAKKQDMHKKRSKLGQLVYRLAYFLVYLILLIFFKIAFKIKIKKDPRINEIEGPILLMANHQSFLDPLFALVAIGPRPLRFVVGHFLRYFSPLKGLLSYIKAIPIHQFSSDPRAVMDIFRALRAGERVVIFPEGQRSINGTTLAYSTDILKIAERTKATVITMEISGAYLAWPRWLKHIFRFGRVFIDLNILCTGEEISSHGYEAFIELLQDRLSHNEAEWVKDKKVRYSARRTARGLELLLHRCPACNRPEAMTSSYKKISCKFCETSYKLNHKLQIEKVGCQGQETKFTDIPSWHQWQYKLEK